MQSETILDIIRNLDNYLDRGRFRKQFMSLVGTQLEDAEIVELLNICATELALRMCTDECSDEVLIHALQEVYKAAIVSV